MVKFKNKMKNKIVLIIILGLLTAIGPFSIDMYLPAFTDIAQNLNTTVDKVMLTLSSFFIGISFGQILYGPLLEKYGRKKPIYFGLIIYMLSTIGCAVSNDINHLIVFRLLQAVGGCVGMVSARAMVRDLFDSGEIAKMFSTLMLVVAISPIIAPTLGGYVTLSFGWRTVFAILFVLVTIILLGVYFILPETKESNPAYSLRPKLIFNNFMHVLKHPQFATYTFTGAISYAGLYAYISGSPYVFMELFKVTKEHYGWIFAIIAIGLISASQLNNILLRRFDSKTIIKTSLLIQAIVGILFVSISIVHLNELYSTVGLIFLFLFCQGLTFPNASALSLTPFVNNAGNASALMGFIQMMIGAFASFLVSVFQNHSIIPMAIVMSSCTIIALVILHFGQKFKTQNPIEETIIEEEVDMISTL